MNARVEVGVTRPRRWRVARAVGRVSPTPPPPVVTPEFTEAMRLVAHVANIKRIGDTIDVALALRGLSKREKIGLATAMICAEDWLHDASIKVKRALI